jgi:hypothetical protein
MALMIDPPSGWMYGFPKALPDPPPEDIKKWLIENGYPQRLVWQLGEDMFYRLWEESNDN